MTQPAVFTPTLTPTTTLMPGSGHVISTPSQKDSEQITLGLLQTNNGCDLPCWWGITPNQTNWKEAEELLKPFSYITLRESATWSMYSVRSPLSEEYSEVDAVRMIFAVQQGVVKEIETGYFNEKTYHLSSFLQKYGVPSRVLVSTYSSDSGMPKNQVPLSIDLYYPEKGINAWYATDATVKGTQIYGCLERSPALFLWSPNEHTQSIDYILGWDKNYIPYMDVYDATGLDVQGFYDKYKNPENEPCLQTPTNLWPGQ